jgi:hypothetical protein
MNLRCELSTKTSTLKGLKLWVLHGIISCDYDEWGMIIGV